MRCTVCSAAAPAGRARCGRCGGRLKETVAQTSTGRLWTTAVALAGGAVLVGAVAFTMSSASQEPSAQTTAPTTAMSSPVQDAGMVQRGSSSAAPVFAGADALREGIAAYNGGNVESALTHFTAAVERDPNSAEALNNLGQALVRMGRAREAIPYFDRAIAIADSEWSYHFNRARAYGELKEWRQAAAGYTEAGRLFPDDYVTQFNLARALQADGDLPRAIQAYARASELAPGQADFHLWYGQALDLSGKTREAVVEYKRFLELDPNASQAEKVKARLIELGQSPTVS